MRKGCNWDTYLIDALREAVKGLAIAYPFNPYEERTWSVSTTLYVGRLKIKAYFNEILLHNFKSVPQASNASRRSSFDIDEFSKVWRGQSLERVISEDEVLSTHSRQNKLPNYYGFRILASAGRSTRRGRWNDGLVPEEGNRRFRTIIPRSYCKRHDFA